MRKLRIRKKMSFDKPPKSYWIIEEVVTSKGHYIEHPGIYGERKNAEKEVSRLKK